ncbi:MAG: hypothetical protein ABC585_05735 [Candidatus Methanosuratincola petrocarbonis]
MLGGYGKPLAIMVLTMVAPIYAGLALGIAYPKYMAYSIAAGAGGAGLCMMAMTVWKSSRFMGLRALGMTRRLPGGQDDFSYVIYRQVHELPRENGRFAYAVRDAVTDEWYLLLLDHPFGDILSQADEVVAGPWIVRIPTAYVDGVQLKTVIRKLSELPREAGGASRLAFWLKVGNEDREVEVPVVYVHSTNRTAEAIYAGKSPGGDPPSREEVAKAYADFVLVDPDFAKLRASDEAKSELLKKQEEVILSIGDDAVKYNIPRVDESPARIPWKLAAAVCVAAAAALIVARYMGWL